ncbi:MULTISPECIES: hypothetical protein [unclassified Agarivorans]|uniref:hypothetical protein n=1 Tax=unclassified Agarivorans TaxID=2636026 RepID=UPI0026E3815D|nr:MULTISPECIES: hypothetical protein [unclassified Agarivorans]MDO6684074.1 hypothetical protein [Agarivorans sp. 3_MG-2023]MDO6714192.1 hypothetical protein [Agarivorans sp. 2_MG-2023]
MKALFLIIVFCLQLLSGATSASEHSLHAQMQNHQGMMHSTMHSTMHSSMDCHGDGLNHNHEAASKMSDLCKLDCQLSLCTSAPAFISTGLSVANMPQAVALSDYRFNLHPSLQELPFRPPLAV